MNDIERSYDGVTWEQVSEHEAVRKLSGYYIDPKLMIDTMRKAPDKIQASTCGAVYRIKQAAR